MKNIISIIILSCIFGCGGKKEGIELKLLNPEIYYTSSPEYRSVYSDSIQREKSGNLVTVSIHNPSNHKLLVVFDKDELQPSPELNKRVGGMCFMINEDGKPKFSTSPLVTFSRDVPEGLFIREMYKDSLVRAKWSALGVEKRNIWEVDAFINNSLVLYPEETRTFSFLVSLPVVREISAERAHSPLYYDNVLSDNCTFRIGYGYDADKVKKILPKYILEELTKNDIEIYDGVITSNEIKLKSR